MSGVARSLQAAIVTLAVVAGGSTLACAAPSVDWSKIPAKTVTLFYPGQGGFDWLRSPAHPGHENVLAGDACLDCHAGMEKNMGELIVSGKRLEPNPIPGKNGTIDLKVQIAYDLENAYFRFQWKTHMDRPGQMHNYMRFDGETWAFYGGPRSSAKVRSGAQPPLYEDRLAMIIDDGSVPMFAQQGCWLTCHRGMRDMPDVATKTQVKSHPLLGDGGLKKKDVRKYLPASRTDAEASWDKTKSAEEIARLKASGGFADLMQWRAHRSNPVGMADDGYVLQYRLFDDGNKMFTWNVDRKTMTPKYMFDRNKTGVKSLTVEDIGVFTKPYAIVKEENAVPYDSEAGWKKGDVLPGRLLSRVEAHGSAADNNNVRGVWRDGTWTVEWVRKLNTGHPQDDKILEKGKAYTFGFAVHDDNVTTRFHHVAFPLRIGFGTKGDIEATRIE